MPHGKSPSPVDTERNLLFGVLALQAALIDNNQFAEVCAAWTTRKHTPLAKLLRERGWITDEEEQEVERLVQRHLKRHGGDVRKSLGGLADAGVRDVIRATGDSDLRKSISSLPPVADYVLVRTLEQTLDAPARDRARYSLTRLYGEGGLGKVWVARDNDLGRDVALKEIKPEQAQHPEACQRFLREAQVTGQLEHPNIVPVYELARRSEDQQPFYCMRLVRGQTLREAIAAYHEREKEGKSEPLELRRLLGAFVNVCQAIGYAHARGVVHRDLKPANVVLGAFGEVVVLDWGLARLVDEQAPEEVAVHVNPPAATAATVAGQQVGTPAYMAPEQAEGRLDQIDGRTDVYGLGAMLFEIMTGHPPHQGSDTAEVLREIVHGDSPRVRKVTPRAPAALAAICAKAMAKSRSERYAKAIALADDVQHWLADQPVSCYAEPLPVRAGRWARKHKLVMATAAAVLFTATVGLAVGLYFVNAEKSRTELARQGEERQRIAAEQSEEKARTEADTATAVKEFLQRDLLQLAANRWQHGQEATGLKIDPDLKVRDLVLRAAMKIEGKFAEQPLVEAEIRRTLGWTLDEIGRPDLAIPQYLRLRELYAAELGTYHPETLASMHGLATSYADAGRHQDALKLFEETLQIQKAKLGPDHPSTLLSMINLAESYRRAGHTQDALKLNEEALQLHQAKLGRDHANTLRCMNNVALCYFAIGRNKDALNLFEATFQLQKANLGPDHTDTLMTMNSLAWSYRRAGRKQDALKLNEEALQLHKAKLGRDHPNTLMSMDNLASSYEDVDRTQDALKLREETVLLSKTKLGPDHPDTLMSMNNLAGSYAAAGRHQDALKLFEETFQLYRAKLGTEHPDTLMSMNNLADSYTTAQPSKALELLERIVSLRERRAGAEPSNSVEQSFLAWTHGQRGEAAQALQDYPAAVNFYARSVEIFSKVDKAGKLTEPFFRDKLNFSQQRLTLCQKAQGAVQDLDFTLKQPAAEIPALLDIRVRFFLKEQKLPTAMESAAKMKQLANEKPDQLYDAACLYALCAGAKTPRADATRLTKECAEEAMTLLKQAIVKGYKNAPHMKQDPDLAALRGRADFDKLLAELEGKK